MAIITSDPPASPYTGGLSAMQMFNMAFGLAVGVGWIMLVGVWLTGAGPLSATLAFFTAGLAMLVIGQSYAYVARSVPVEGGEFGFSMRAFGRAKGFWVGWFLAMAYVVVIAFEMSALASVVREVIPGLPDAQSLTGRAANLVIGVAGLLVVVTANLHSTAAAARFQDALVALKVAASIILVGLGFAYGRVENVLPLIEAGRDGTGTPGFLTVLAMAPFFFAGFGPIVQAVKEARSPQTLERLPWIFAAVVTATFLFYAAAIWATAAIAPRDVLAGAPIPAAAAFLHGSGSAGYRIIVGLALMGLLTMLNGLFFTTVRLIQVMGQEQLIPLEFGRLHNNIPVASAVLTTGSSVLIAGAAGSLLPPLVNVATVGVCTAMAAMCAISLRLRRQSSSPKVSSLAPAVGLLVAVLMALTPIYEAAVARDATLPTEWLIIAGWALAGWLLGRVRRKPDGTR